MTSPLLSRRDMLKLAAAGALGYSMSGWFEGLANAAAAHPARKRSCILLWMNGGPSQMDTFDMKPGHKNGGPIKEIATAVPGVRFSEYLPKIAQHTKRMAIVRSMSTKEGDHTRAAYYLRTGYLPQGGIQYPTMGSFLSKELGKDDAALPNFVSVGPAPLLSPGAYNPGFLGPEYAPLIIGNQGYGIGGQPLAYANALKVEDLLPPKEIDDKQVVSRLDLVRELQADFSATRPGLASSSQQAAYDRAVRLMRTGARKAFDLDDEKSSLRDAYGRNLFGQGCLLARRLIERNVPFVEVTLSNVTGAQYGWDTHFAGSFDHIKALSQVLDPAWSTLMTDLKERGLFESTLIVWMGEFGRSPMLNPQKGREHFANAWSAVLAGGGIKGGQVYGKTSPDGNTVSENPVSAPNFMATIVKALGLDPTKQNMSNVGRPIRLADAGAKPIKEVVA